MISVKDLVKTYKGEPALSRVSLELPRGAVLGLIGTNGAGKSTLLRILSGILMQDSGEVLIEGESVFENSAVKSRVNFISDEGYLIPSFTLETMAGLYASMRDNFSMEKFHKLCRTMRLDPTRRVNSFSKGMKRQGEVILALSSGTDYLFFDETFDGLDPIARESARKIIAESVAENGTTVILSSHNLSEIENICDRIALLDSGRLVFHKSVEDAVNKTKKYQAVFENEPDLSLIPPALVRCAKSGKLLTFVSELSEGEVERIISHAFVDNALIYLESVGLSLEEIFSLEVEKFQLGKGVTNV